MEMRLGKIATGGVNDKHEIEVLRWSFMGLLTPLVRTTMPDKSMEFRRHFHSRAMPKLGAMLIKVLTRSEV